MPKIAKTKKKVSISKTKTVTKPKTANKSKVAIKPKVTVSNKSKEVSKGPIKISKNYVPKDNEKYMCENIKLFVE